MDRTRSRNSRGRGRRSDTEDIRILARGHIGVAGTDSGARATADDTEREGDDDLQRYAGLAAGALNRLAAD